MLSWFAIAKVVWSNRYCCFCSGGVEWWNQLKGFQLLDFSGEAVFVAGSVGGATGAALVVAVAAGVGAGVGAAETGAGGGSGRTPSGNLSSGFTAVYV